MEEIKGLSVTKEKDGCIEESTMFTFSPGEVEQNEINSKNASLLEKVKFIPFSPSFKRESGLGFLEVLLYGYIDFFSFNGENTIYLTNEQLAYIFGTSVSSIKRSLKILKEKGLVDYTVKTFSTGHNIKSVRKLKLTHYESPSGQIEPSVVGQIEPQLITSINNYISKDIGRKSSSYREKPTTTDINKDKYIYTPKKEYGSEDLLFLKDFLLKKYPIEIAGISDHRALQNLKMVCSPRKDRDEWMSPDWKVNLEKFLSGYLKNTEERFLVRSVSRLKDLVKDWRERGGAKKEKVRPIL